MTLSEHCRAAIAAIDAHPCPTYEQLLEVLSSHRELLDRTRTFAERLEEARTIHRGKVPMFAAAGVATTLYRDLLAEDDEHRAGAVVTGVVVAFPRRRT